ncbi:MAG TPA: hypothetical protein VFT29_19990 [Gemmatimonadaceae bacterium]|nr:hypothetical protein [Gemmatimonadaceae bacterium]
MIRLGNRIALVLGLTAALAAAPSPLAAQGAPAVQRPTFWGSIALGAAGITDSGMIHSSLGVAMQRRHLIVIGRVTGNAQGNDTDGYRTRIGDAGVLAGYATTPGPLHLSIAGGLAIVTDINDSTTVGFPIEAQATYRFLPWVGLGVRIFTVPNELANYGGISLALQVGRLK